MNFNVTKLKDGIHRFALRCLRALRGQIMVRETLSQGKFRGRCLLLLWILWGLSIYADAGERPSNAPDQSPIAMATLEPSMNHKEVTIRFAVSKLGGVSQLSVPGKAPSFVIEAKSEHDRKDLTVWVEGELAEVLDRLQLSFNGSDPLRKGAIIVATGSLEFFPGEGDRKGHEWYNLKVVKWQDFRIVRPDQDR